MGRVSADRRIQAFGLREEVLTEEACGALCNLTVNSPENAHALAGTLCKECSP